jgi:hypothetical protein
MRITALCGIRAYKIALRERELAKRQAKASKKHRWKTNVKEQCPRKTAGK